MTFGGDESPYLLDHAALARMPVSPGQPGEVEVIDVPPRKRVLFLSRDNGTVTLWQQPLPDPRKYVIGARWHPEWPVAFVIDQRTGDQVAMFRQPCTPAQFADRVYLLGKFYNWAFLVPEVNESDFRDALLSTSYPLAYVYSRQRDPHGIGSGLPEHMGFEMTDVSRAQLVHAFQNAVRGNGIGIRSPLAIEECRAFAIQPDGKPGVPAGYCDECVWAAALAGFRLQYAPRPAPAIRRPNPFEPPRTHR